MQSLLDLHFLVDKYADLLPKLDVDGDNQEEHSTMLLWLQNQVGDGTPIPTYVDQCLNWLDRFAERKSSPRQGNAAIDRPLLTLNPQTCSYPNLPSW
ncbi:MAG TPA: hypothetical protein VN708_21835 [Terriglobales bacterium]|nr:hypothetical protein [Terriglobales bacterium]